MKRAPLIVMVVALVLIGPATFLFARLHALDVGLASIRAGETRAQVVSVLGEPQQQLLSPARAMRPRLEGAPAAAANPVRVEYLYRAWPLPGAWVVDFSGGRVVGTARR